MITLSSFIRGLVDMLPEHNSLKKEDNPLFQILDKSVGEWFDNHDIQEVYDSLFLTEAEGAYLDLHGKDYGVYRLDGESDDDYRNRIVMDKLEYLTPEYLVDVYGLTLYTLVDGFSLGDNTMASDNPFINTGGYMSVADDTVKNILNNKFIVDGGIVWL